MWSPVDLRKANELFRRRLVEARETAGVTQTELAVRLGEHQSLVAKIESGERTVTPVELLLLLSALDSDPAEFIASLDEELNLQPGRVRMRRHRKPQQ